MTNDTDVSSVTSYSKNHVLYNNGRHVSNLTEKHHLFSNKVHCILISKKLINAFRLRITKRTSCKGSSLFKGYRDEKKKKIQFFKGKNQ